MPIEILMPALSPTMTEGTLAKWLKAEGDVVSAGDVIAEIETDKATMEVEAVDEGVLGRIVVKDGTDNVPVNNVIALLLEDGEDKSVLDDYVVASNENPEFSEESSRSQRSDESKEAPSTTSPKLSAAAPVSSPKLAPKPAADNRQLTTDNRTAASPLARRIASQNGIDLSSVVGTGPRGRIIKADIEEAIARGGSGGVVRRNPAEFMNIPNTNMRKVVARRLLEAKQQIPHFYLTIDCEMDALLDVRKQLNDKAVASAGKDNPPAYKLSVNDFIIKASALALKDVPEANASWYDDAIVQYSNVDISVAVAIEGGLITPIIQNADQKTLPQISGEMKELAARAREGALQPHEYEGGGFSISNLGMYGIKQFSAIVNPPQSCILAVGKGEERVIVKDGEFAIANMMTVTLSVDHRSVDGAVGANFLTAFKQYIESPVTMFV